MQRTDRESEQWREVHRVRGVGWRAAAYGSVLALPSLLVWLLAELRQEPHLATAWLSGCLVAVAVAIIAACGGRREDIVLDAHGITERFALRRPVRTAWRDVLGAQHLAGGARLVTTQGSRELPPQVERLEALVQRVAMAVAEQQRESASPTASVQQVAAWLQIEPEGALVASRGSMALSFVALFVLAAVLTVSGLGLLALLLAGLVWRSLAGEPRQVRATVHGLAVATLTGRRRRYPWSSIQGLERRGLRWVVLTSRGDVNLPLSLHGVEDLLAGVSRVLAARDAGEVLPRLESVPASALSLAGSKVSPDTARGLSRSDR